MKRLIFAVAGILIIGSGCATRIQDLGDGRYRVRPKNSFRYIVTDDTCMTHKTK